MQKHKKLKLFCKRSWWAFSKCESKLNGEQVWSLPLGALLLWPLGPPQNHGHGWLYDHARGNDFRRFSCIHSLFGILLMLDRPDVQILDPQLTEAFADLIENWRDMNSPARADDQKRTLAIPRFQRGYRFWRGVICLRKKIRSDPKEWAFLLQQVQSDCFGGNFQDLRKTLLLALQPLF